MGEARSGDRHPADTGWPARTRADGGTGSAPGADGVTFPDTAAQPAPVAEPTPTPAPAPAGRRRLDLSVPQVAGSAVAAVVAAKLASNLGVYGTIAGAGVVSALGTCGGSVLQYVFRHTGRRVQEAAVQAGPVARRALTRADGAHRAAGAAPGKDLDRTRTLPAPEDTDDAAADAAAHDGYGAATSYRAGRQRRWRRPVVAVALAFGLTMAGITGYEAIAGENLSGHGGTTIGNAFTGHSTGHSGGGRSGTGHDGDGDGASTDSPTPSAPADRHPGGGEPSAPHPTTTAPGGGSGSPVTPEPSPSAPAPTTPPATPDPAPTTGSGDGGTGDSGGGAATTGPEAPQRDGG